MAACAAHHEGERASRVCVPPSVWPFRSLGRVNQACEMRIDMGQWLVCHVASPPRNFLLENGRHRGVDGLVAVPLPQAIQHVIPRPPEGSACTPKAPEVIGSTASIDQVLLPEVPPELGGVVQSEWAGQFLAGRLLEQVCRFEQVAGHQQTKFPFGKRSQQLGVAVQKASKVDRRWPRHEVHEHVRTPVRGDADRQLVWEVPNRLLSPPSKGEVWQLLWPQGGRPGRKRDFPDAERLVKRLVAHELTLSFVPDVTQRLWRTVTRRKYQLTRNRVQLQNRLESLLEEAHIKVSALVSDLLGASARRMLRTIGTGETDPAALAALGSSRLHATPEQLADGLGAAADMPPLYRRLLVMTLAELDLLESHMLQLDEELAALLRVHQAPVQRLAAVPGFGVDSAQQVIAEVGPTATTFPTAKHLASWVGACPGHDESAGVNRSHRVPNGNRQMRRLLNQCAHAAVRTKGSIFELVYRRFVGRLGHAQAIGAVAHRLCRLVWKILHDGVTYEERGPIVSQARAQRRAAKMLRELRSLGYRVELIPSRLGTRCDRGDFRPCLNGWPTSRDVVLPTLRPLCRQFARSNDGMATVPSSVVLSCFVDLPLLVRPCSCRSREFH